MAWHPDRQGGCCCFYGKQTVCQSRNQWIRYTLAAIAHDIVEEDTKQCRWSHACQELFGLFHYRLEYAKQRLLQVVLQVVLGIYGQAVLQSIDGVFSLLICLGALGCLHKPPLPRECSHSC